MKSRSIELAADPRTVWDALTAAGLQEWYFRLSLDGTFAPGARVRWSVPDGPVAEEGEVVAVDPPKRLELRTNFMFEPKLAEETPHTTVWEIVPSAGGCVVTMSWDAGPVTDRLLDSDAGNMLASLRLAVDSAARDELKRLPEIGDVKILDVAPDRVGDYQHYFDDVAFRDFPSWQFCYCMETHRTHDEEEWARRTGADNRRDMSAMIARREVTALLAYVDGKPVGWCNYGETTHLSGVMMKLKLDVPDHDQVGSVACFVIAAPYRGHGVATKLLDAAIERLRAKGLRAVEAYPRKEGDGSAQAHYRGSLRMYEKAGFEPYRETDRYYVVRKQLA